MEVCLLDGKLLCAQGFDGPVGEGCLGEKGCERRGGVAWKADVFAAFLFAVLDWLFDVSFGVVDCFYKNRLDGRSLVSLSQDSLKK